MDKDKLYQWFTEHNIKSISPHMTIFLLDIVEELKPRIEIVRDDELRKDLEEYKNALVTVCRTAAIQQKAVIDKFDVLIHRRDG